jgi:hypothetical protein
VRYLELATVVLFWWHPVAWWARHHLRRAEEQACDALVVEWRPAGTRIYANGLLATLEFLAGRARAIPGLATGALGTVQVKERLTMILNPECRGKAPLLQRGSVAAVAVAALVLFPTWADTSSPDEAAAAGDVLAVEHEIADLEYQLQELNAKRMELERVLETVRLKRARMEFEKQRDELVAQGKGDKAEQLRLELEEREHELARMQEQTDQIRRTSSLEHELRKLELDIEAARAAGDEARAADLELKARQLQVEMERTELHAQKEMHERELSHKITQIKRQIEILSGQGRTEEARELEKALQELTEHQDTQERSERDEGAR